MAATGHLAGVAIATDQHALVEGLAVAALLAGPGVTTAALLRRVTVWTRLVCGLAAAICVNGIVAEVMLVLHLWSIPGGATAVGVISAALWLVAPALRDDAVAAVSPPAPDPRVAS
ncbi:hypothetical protein ACI798_17765 [Geodermatophilus sp. SYSU D01045]